MPCWALNATGNWKTCSHVSAPYISAISQRPCLTVSVPIEDGGRTVGVFGADLSLATA
ncbi:PDC sensor domain-containing protein [Anaeroselena agilis]|uniref:PDC sensor domain-containing protein n=1 Tax=Anaeroselena agilis TaxID=3063788 RepID=UPI0039B6F7E2